MGEWRCKKHKPAAQMRIQKADLKPAWGCVPKQEPENNRTQ